MMRFKMETLLQAEGRNPKVLNFEEARALMVEGWQAADLHVHTLHSYDVIPTEHVDPLSLYNKARRLGMSHIAFTDHDTMAAYDEIGWTREGLVPAVEVKVLDPKNVGHTVHINVYLLNRRHLREIRKIVGTAQDIIKLTDYLRDERLPFIFNHPFWHEPDEAPNLRAVLDIVEYFPVLEYNMGRIDRLNALALRLANTASKGIVAATDSHVGAVGKAFTIARGGSFEEFFGRISSRESHICPADLTLPQFKEETALRIRRLFDRANWLHAKDSLTMDTGNILVDALIRRLARQRNGVPGTSHRIFRTIIEGFSSSGIPGSLYLRSQNALADRIGRLFESVENAA